MSTIDQSRADLNRAIVNQQIDHAQRSRSNDAVVVRRTDAKRVAVTDGIDAPSSGTPTNAANVAASTTTAGPNPFQGLGQGETAGIVLAQSVPMEVAVEGQNGQLGKFESVVSGLVTAAGGPNDAGNVRRGFLLLANDAASLSEEELGSEVFRSAQTLGEKIVRTAKEDKQTTKLSFTKSDLTTTSFPATMDINAYVQAVLRESYLLQQDEVRDFAEQVDEINQQRKAFRKRLQDLRALKSKIATGDASAEEIQAAAEQLGVSLTPEQIDQVSTDYQWPQQAELDAAEAQLAKLEGNDDSSNTPTAEAYYPGVTSAVTSQFAITSATGGDPSAYFMHAIAVHDGQLGHGLHNAEDAFAVSGAGTPAEESNEPMDMGMLVDGAHAETSSMEVGHLQTVVTTLAWSVIQGDHGGPSATVLNAMLEGMTPSQLNALHNNPELWRDLNRATDNAFDTAYGAYQQMSASGYIAATGSEAPALELFMVAQKNNFAPPYMEKAQAAMWGLSGSDARSLLATLDQMGVPNDKFNSMLTACNPQNLFAGADPASMTFLLKHGDPANPIFTAWAYANKPVEPEVSDDPEVKAKTIDDLKEKISALQEQKAKDVQAHDTGTIQAAISSNIENDLQATQEDLDSADGDAQLRQLDLQNASQRSQELMQMMSNLSKTLHDTMMAVIRNMGG